ncbi:MAG: methyltransferase [Micavibrio sp.]|nr:MAG: methyltransferase [Micavibrio sp.]
MSQKHTTRYNNRGASYSARPQYPPELITGAIQKSGLQSGDTVVDIGAGSGRLTKALLELGFTVRAVEPSDMRLEAKKNLESYPDFQIYEGEAVKPNIPEHTYGKIKAIFAGQSLHWWRHQFKEAVREWNKFLHPTGKLIALTQHFNDSSEVCQHIDTTLSRICPGYDDQIVKLLYKNSPGFSNYEYRRYLDFENRHLDVAKFDFTTDEQGFRNLLTSFSFTPNPETQREDLNQLLDTMVREVFQKHAQGGEITIPYVSKIWHGTLITPDLIR